MSKQTWFSKLFGFHEKDIRKGLRIHDLFEFNVNSLLLLSKSNNREFHIGKFSTPSLQDLKAEAIRYKINNNLSTTTIQSSGLTYDHLPIHDIKDMHLEYPYAVFQAASQFNCLEFVSPNVIPENGILDYVYDNTQGPSCAIACAAGTLYRNYLVPMNHPQTGKKQYGQSRDCQINNLDKLEELLENDKHNYWEVRNGYVFSPSNDHLDRLNQYLKSLSEEQLEELRGVIKIGVQSDTEVTLSRTDNGPSCTSPVLVTQAYCSAISCAYSDQDNVHWEGLARLALESAYESTLLLTVIQALKRRQQQQNQTSSSSITTSTLEVSSESDEGLHDTYHNDVFLTFLGGGVFGNEPEWIARAIARAMAIVHIHFPEASLRVHICHFRYVREEMSFMIDEIYRYEVERLTELQRKNDETPDEL
jgi:hypothetical protein